MSSAGAADLYMSMDSLGIAGCGWKAAPTAVRDKARLGNLASRERGPHVSGRGCWVSIDLRDGQ